MFIFYGTGVALTKHGQLGVSLLFFDGKLIKSR